MPFLHGFRRIIFEYQPLVDEIVGVLGIDDPKKWKASGRNRSCTTPAALVELLNREAQSPFYEEAVSYSLLKAAEFGIVHEAEILLQYGADLNFEDPVTYYTSLHIAVLRNQPEMVELLAQHGADINKRDRIHESSPLDLASEELERVPCLLRLLDLGADVNAADKNGKTALLHALASSDGVQIHNIENIKLLLERGADVKAVTKDGDTVFTFIIFLLGEMTGSDKEEARMIDCFCTKVTQLLLAHGADPSECPTHECLVYLCFNNFKLHFQLLLLLLESGAQYHCSQHGPSCWSGFHILFERLCAYLNNAEKKSLWADMLEKAETVLDVMLASTARIQLPPSFEISPASCRFHGDKIMALYKHVKQLQHSPATLKHLSKVYLRQHLRPWPLEGKIKRLPLPDRLKWYLMIKQNSSNECGGL